MARSEADFPYGKSHSKTGIRNRLLYEDGWTLSFPVNEFGAREKS
jgi:hypothetical protein